MTTYLEERQAVIARMTVPITRGRACGDCSACCEVMAVPDLWPQGKPAWTPCPQLTEPGRCGCYDSRPASCRNYTCGWLDGIGEEEHRPDRSGVVINAQGGPGWEDFVRLACGRRSNAGVLVFREVWPGAAEEPGPAGLLGTLICSGVPVAVLREDRTVAVNGPATHGWQEARWVDGARK
jgi:hypothetical protein